MSERLSGIRPGMSQEEFEDPKISAEMVEVVLLMQYAREIKFHLFKSLALSNDII